MNESNQNRIIPAKEFNEIYLDRQYTSLRGLNDACRRGDIPAKKMGRIWYVDVDAWERKMRVEIEK